MGRFLDENDSGGRECRMTGPVHDLTYLGILIVHGLSAGHDDARAVLSMGQ